MKRIISVLMFFMMLFSTLSGGRIAAENSLMVVDSPQTNEVLELREKNSETYRLEDGSYECIVFAENKYFEDSTGKLVEINNTIVPKKNIVAGREYGFANKANSTGFYFSANEPAILVSLQAQALSFEIKTSTAVKPLIGGLENTQEIAEYSLKGDNFFAYSSVFDHTDFVYEVKNDMLKEYIVLNKAESPTEFTFSFNTEGYTVAYTEHGSVGFYNCEKKLVFELGDLFAVDSANVYTEDLTCTIGDSANGRTEIVLSLSKDYAYDSARVYPILIDPSIMITGASNTKDSYVSSRKSDANYYMSTHLKTGRDEEFYVRRTYIKFDLPSSLTGKTVTSAYINIRMFTGATPSINAYRVTGNWTSSGITWNNKPGYTTTNGSGTGVPSTNNWYKLYVTNIVKSWINGTYVNYGFMIKDATESGTSQWTAFYSSDADSPNKPELRITYENSHSITYHGNGNSGGSVPASQTALSGTNVTLRTNSGNLVKKDCDFLGWNTLPNGNGTHYNAGQTINMPDGNMILYASWRNETYEIGLEAVSDYSNSGTGLSTLNTSIDCLSGLSTKILDSPNLWIEKFSLIDNFVWEIDFKDVSFGGNDCNFADSVDLAAYCGHGYPSSGFKLANGSHNDADVSRSDLKLGDVDLEWLLTFTCNFLNCDKSAIGPIMQGLHMVCGYKTDMTVTANGGSTFANYATSGGKCVREAWRQYGVSTQSVFSGNKTSIFCHSSCMNDFLWGYGNTVTDPPTFNTQSNSDYVFYNYGVIW